MTEPKTNHVLMLEPPIAMTEEEWVEELKVWLADHETCGKVMKRLFYKNNQTIPEIGTPDGDLWAVLEEHTVILDQRIALVGEHFNLQLERTEVVHGRADA